MRTATQAAATLDKVVALLSGQKLIDVYSENVRILRSRSIAAEKKADAGLVAKLLETRMELLGIDVDSILDGIAY